MRLRRIFTGLDCFICTVPSQIQLRQYSTLRLNPSSRNLSSRTSSCKAKTSKSQAAAHKLLQPPILLPSTAYNYTPQKQKRDKMMSQSVQIPGLTLINNLTPHAIAPTSEGGFISAGPGPKSQVAAASTKRTTSTTTTTTATTTATAIPPPKKKENKKAKARRLLAEAEAQAQAQTQPAVNHNGYAHPPNQYEPTVFS